MYDDDQDVEANRTQVDLSRPPVLVAHHHQLNISVPIGATARLSCTVVMLIVKIGNMYIAHFIFAGEQCGE